MWITVAVLILTSLLVETIAQSGFCTREISGLPVVDMCQNGSWTLGRVFLSVNSNSLGDNSRCECTLRGRTTSQNTATTVTMWQLVNSPSGCINQHVVNVAWPSEPGVSGGSSNNITCFTPVNQAFTTATYTQPVSLTQLRSDVILSIGFCLFLQPDDYASDNLELTCQGAVTTSTVTTTPVTPSSSSTKLPSSTTPTSLPFSSSVPSVTSKVSVSTVPSSPGSDVSSSVTTTSSDNASSAGVVADTAPLVAVAVVGWLLTLALAVVVLLLSLRLRRKSTSSAGAGAENSAYTSLSDVTRVAPRADPNYSVIQSAAGNDAAALRDVYERVDGAAV